MSNSNPNIKFSAARDRQIAYKNGLSYRYIECEIQTPVVEQELSNNQPINLAIVIDASGSMNGYPIQAAKDSALEIVERLNQNDYLSVVSFADDSITHLSQQKMDHDGKEEAKTVILNLKTRGTTDLSGGWFRGAKEVSEQMEEQEIGLNHVILLSDGHANRGILDPEILANYASEMRDRGLYTSTVGIGDGYSMTQLQALAEAGGGRMHDAEHAHEIAEVVLAELGEVRKTFAENIKVILQGDDRTTVSILEGFPLEKNGSDVIAHLGSMASDSKRSVIWQVILPSGDDGEIITLKAKCLWTRSKDNEIIRTRNLKLDFTLESALENESQLRDQNVSLRVAKSWHAKILRHAMGLNRDRDFRTASDYVRSQLNHFKRYCRGIKGTERLIHELSRLIRRVNYSMNERSRKEVELYSYKMQKGDEDFRAEVRPHYSKYLN